jgi:hypothetical protein
MKYQDLVIKDGKFIGEFEKMYQLFDDPWNQKKDGYVENSISRNMVCNFIKKYNINSMVEFGCGLGKTTDFISSQTNIDILGIDISETSINKAKLTYPNLKFEVNDIRNIEVYSNYSSFFFSEITWYLLEDKLIDNLFEIMNEKFKGKYFIHNLVFYRGQQKYGNNYFTSLEEFINFCPFKLIGNVKIDFADLDCIETSSVFLIE